MEFAEPEGSIPLQERVLSSKSTKEHLADIATGPQGVSNETERQASARRKYLKTLQTMTQYGPRATTKIVLRDSIVPVKASELKAIASDSSRCVVTNLQTVLGTVPAAILRADDLVSIQVSVNELSPNSDVDTNSDVAKEVVRDAEATEFEQIQQQDDK